MRQDDRELLAPDTGGEVRVPTPAAVITGLVVSMLMTVVAVAELPALSVAVRVIVWFAPTASTVTSAGQLATPDRASEQV